MSRRVDEVRRVHLKMPAAPIHTELLHLHCYDIPYDMPKEIIDFGEANQEHSGKKNKQHVCRRSTSCFPILSQAL